MNLLVYDVFYEKNVPMFLLLLLFYKFKIPKHIIKKEVLYERKIDLHVSMLISLATKFPTI